MPPNPVASLRVSRHQIPAYNLIPNTSILNKPLLHYHEAFPRATVTASAIESHLTSIGVVEPQWRFTMYSATHFHSTTHEVLCISHGKAKLCFGGEDNPSRVEKVVEKGDVLVLPAGVGHRLLDDMTVGGGFEMVGSYPPGCQWDMCYGKKEEEASVRNIGKLAWFQKDPIYGDRGPALDV
ncbi:RmlC-like cupin domain-containing protein [Biscogniauxia sp. FL1348]|nr:RmlC-like cupin domain-containing protein [Biscogniauxia sp. FL1348]